VGVGVHSVEESKNEESLERKKKRSLTKEDVVKYSYWSPPTEIKT